MLFADAEADEAVAGDEYESDAGPLERRVVVAVAGIGCYEAVVEVAAVDYEVDYYIGQSLVAGGFVVVVVAVVEGMRRRMIA